MASRVFLVCHPNFTTVRSTCQNVKRLIWGLCRIQVRYWTPQWQAPRQQGDYSNHALLVINDRRSRTRLQRTHSRQIDTQHIHTYTFIKTDGLVQSVTHIYILMQKRYKTRTCIHAQTGMRSWINTLGHHPRDEPYGTSISSSITQSQKMAGSPGVCAWQSEFISCVYCMSTHI